MALPEYLPSQKEMDKRRKPIPIVNPDHISQKDDTRIRQWGLEVMQKHESRLKNNIPHGTIVFEKEIEPEEVDIRGLFPFASAGLNLYYFIMKDASKWVLRVCCTKGAKTKNICQGVILAQLTYAQI